MSGDEDLGDEDEDEMGDFEDLEGEEGSDDEDEELDEDEDEEAEEDEDEDASMGPPASTTRRSASAAPAAARAKAHDDRTMVKQLKQAASADVEKGRDVKKQLVRPLPSSCSVSLARPYSHADAPHLHLSPLFLPSPHALLLAHPVVLRLAPRGAHQAPEGRRRRQPPPAAGLRRRAPVRRGRRRARRGAARGGRAGRGAVCAARGASPSSRLPSPPLASPFSCLDD